MYDFISLEYTSRSGIIGSYGNFIFNHLKPPECFPKQLHNFFSFFFFWLCPQHAEIPKLGIKPRPWGNTGSLIHWTTRELQLHNFIFTPAMHMGSYFSTSSPTLVILCSLNYTTLMGMKWYLTVDLLANDTEHLFMCLLTTCLPALRTIYSVLAHSYWLLPYSLFNHLLQYLLCWY